MSPAYRDPLIEKILRRPEARVKITFLFLILQYLIYAMLVAGLLIFLYVIITIPG